MTRICCIGVWGDPYESPALQWVPMRLPLIGTAPHPIAHALHPEGISNDEYDGRISELTPPSFC